MTAEGEDRPVRFVARLSTSIKIFAVMTLALLPLGLIALLASLQANRSSDRERRADLNVAVSEASRKLGIELVSDMVVLGQGARVATFEPASVACARPEAIFAARPGRQVAFAIFGASDVPVCATRGFSIARPAVDLVDPKVRLRVANDALELVVPARGTSGVAVIRYPTATLTAFARLAGYNVPNRLRIDVEGQSLWLSEFETDAPLARTESASSVIGVAGATLDMSVARAPYSANEALVTFLPLLMWAAGAVVAFVIVEGLLIHPLKRLRQDVRALVPGAEMPRARSATPAIEIGELRGDFARFADRIAAREADLDRALADQVKLTREVHHRVKNNLQVIASLISLHARGAVGGASVAAAYATIQRRVDALAIVHRNHFAELEVSQGIGIRALLSELASNFRANATPGTPVASIAVTADATIVGLDIAMPLAFLFTELAEEAMQNRPGAPITVSGLTNADAMTGTLVMASPALIGEPHASAQTQRIVEGLARQLRAPLTHDREAGRYSIGFPIMREEKKSDEG